MTFLVYMALQWGAAVLVFFGDNLILRGVLSGIRWKRIVGIVLYCLSGAILLVLGIVLFTGHLVRCP